MSIDWSQFKPIDGGVNWDDFTPIDTSRDDAEATRFASQSAARAEAIEREQAPVRRRMERAASVSDMDTGAQPEPESPAPRARRGLMDDGLTDEERRNRRVQEVGFARASAERRDLQDTAARVTERRERMAPSGTIGPVSEVDVAASRAAAAVTRMGLPGAAGLTEEAVQGYGDTLVATSRALPQTFALMTDVAQLLTAGNIGADSGRALRQIDANLGKDASAESRSKAAVLAQLVERGDAAGVAAFLMANPKFALDTAIPSMATFIPAAGGGIAAAQLVNLSRAARALPAAERAAIQAGAATAGSNLTNTLLNAGNTYAETGSYDAAGTAGVFSMLAGRLFKGGAEGALARGTAPGALRIMGREAGQEATESLGQSIGQQTAENRFEPAKAGAQAALEGTLGAIGGGLAGAVLDREQPALPPVPSAREVIDRSFGPRVRNFTEPDSPSAQAGLTPIVVPEQTPVTTDPIQRPSDQDILARVFPPNEQATAAAGVVPTAPVLAPEAQAKEAPAAAVPDFSTPTVAPRGDVAPTVPAPIDWDSFTPLGAEQPAAEPVAARPAEQKPSPIPGARPTFTQSAAQPISRGLPAQPQMRAEPARGDFSPAQAAEPESSPRPGAQAQPEQRTDPAVARSELRADIGPYSERVQIVRADEVPADVDKRAEAYFDPRSGRVVLIDDNIKPEVGSNGQVILDKRQRRTWVAWHELYHSAKDGQDNRLGRVRNAQGYTAELQRAALNPTVSRIADAIRAERGGLARGIAIEEALVELGAAMETGRYDEIADRYNVNVSPDLQRSTRAALRGFAARIKQWLAKTFGFNTKRWSDSDVYNLLRGYRAEIERPAAATRSAPVPVSSGPRGAAPAARVLFEVAPDPNDAELSARWNRLPAQRRTEISERVVGEQLAPLLDALGVQGEIAPQVGSYLDDTNPSFSLTTSDPRAALVAGAIGYAGAQDSMMVVHGEPFEGGEPVGAVRVTLPQEGFDFVRQVYDRLRRIEVGGERPVAGQTTVGREMLILNYSNVPTETLVKLVADALDSTFEVGRQSLFAAFPQKSEYDYASQDRGVRDARGVSATVPEWAEVLDRARRETTAAIGRELDGARQSIGRDNERTVPAGPAEPAVRSGRTSGSRGSGGPGSVEIVGIHYGKTKTPILSGSMFGSGIRGAEQRRIADAQDKRLKRRVYFYVGKRGQELPRPEAGLGPWVYRANLGNLYESGVSPALTYAGFSQGLDAEEVFNNFESAVLDAGYDGYVSRSGGTVDVAVVLNRDVPAELMGSRAELGRAPVLESRGREFDDLEIPESAYSDELDRLATEGMEVTEEPDETELEFQRQMQAELDDLDGADTGKMDELDRIPRSKMNFLTGTQTDKPIDLYKALPEESSARLLNAWRTIAKKASAFRLGKSGSKKALPSFGKMPFDIAPLQKLADSMKLAEASERNARPGQPTIKRVRVKRYSPQDGMADSGVRIVFEMSNGENKTAELWYHTDDGYGALEQNRYSGPIPFYTAHTALLGKNSGLGTYFYQLVAAYADRTGVPLMPDFGLTTVNGYRRTEQMISSALRSGNVMAVFPGRRQNVFGWKEIANAEEQDRNMVRLLIASARNAQATAPEIVDMVYDAKADTFSFENGLPGAEEVIKLLTMKGDGVVVKDGQRKRLRADLDRRARELGVPPERVIASYDRGFGRDTYARAVLSQMIVDGKKPAPLSKPILYSTGRNTKHATSQKGFDQAVDEAMVTKDALQNITLSLTPDVLQKLGVERKSITTNAGVLRKMRFDHGLSLRQIKSIPSEIADPVMVLRNPSNDERFLVVSSQVRPERGSPSPVVYAVDPKGKTAKVFIATGYGDGTFAQQFEKWARENRVLYANKDKALALGKEIRGQFPGVSSRAEGFRPEQYLTPAGLGSSAPEWTERPLLSKGREPREIGVQSLSVSRGRAQTQSQEFKRWFGDSKVVDENGKPLVVYHGTQGDISEFRDDIEGRAGYYFTADKQFANSFAEGYGANVMPVYLSISKPADLRRGVPGSVYDALETQGYSRLVELYESDPDEIWNFLDGDSELAEALGRAGYDGMRLSEPAGRRKVFSWVAFRPEQIKSAIGNRGTFDPSNPNIIESRSRGNPLNSFDLPDETRFEAVRRVMQDSMLRVKQVQDIIAGRGGVLSEAGDVYRAEERMHGRIQSTLEDFKNEVMRPLMEKLADNKLSLDELALFAYAKHAPERNAYIDTINPRLNGEGSGMSNRTAAALLQRFRTEGKFDALEDAHRDLMAAGEQTRRTMLDAGLIDQDTYDNWTRLYQNYIPLRGFENVDEEGKAFKGAGRGINVRGEETMRALGRRSRAANLIENVILDYERAVIRSERNSVGKSLLQLVLDNPDPELWEIDAQRTTRTLDKTRGLVVEKKLVDKGEDTIGVKVGGEVVYVKVKDELLARALRKGFLDESGDWQRLIAENVGWYTNWLRNTLTRWNPAFMVVNAIRDAQTGVFSTMDTLGAGAVPAFTKHYFGAMRSAWRSERGGLDPLNSRWDRWFREYRDAGGITGGFFMRDLDAVADELRAELLDAGGSVTPRGKGLGRVADTAYVKMRGTTAGRMAAKTVRLVETLGSVSENMTRVAAYRTAREMGKTPAEAASIAKNLTTNFNRKGEIGTGMSALYLFYNASVQGATRTLQALQSRQVQVAMATMTGMAFALALINAEWGGEDDDGVRNWDKIPGFEKERNLIIMLPPKDGRAQYVKIPMAYGFNIFPVLGNAMADTLRNLRDPSQGKTASQSAVSLVSAIFGSFNPFGGGFDPSNPVQAAMAAAPTVIDLPINLATETDTFGRTAAPPKNDYNPRPDSERFFLSDAGTVQQRIARWVNSTSGGNQAQSGRIDITPATIETTVRGATGGLGVFLSDVASTLLQLGDASEDVNPRNIPFFKSLYGKFDEKTTAAQFYEARKEIADDYKQLLAAMRFGIKVDMEDPKNQALMRVGRYIDKTNEYMADLRKWELRVVDDETLSKAEKKKQREEIAKLREGLMRDFNREFQRTFAPVR